MARLYDLSRWRNQCAPMVLAEEPLCRFCAAMDILTPATVVDHIVPVRVNPDLAFERSNLQPLCKAHHDSAKQQIERSGYHGEVDACGYPIDPTHPANQRRVTEPVTPGEGSSFVPGLLLPRGLPEQTEMAPRMTKFVTHGR